jgi:hypothetical protein
MRSRGRRRVLCQSLNVRSFLNAWHELRVSKCRKFGPRVPPQSDTPGTSAGRTKRLTLFLPIALKLSTVNVQTMRVIRRRAPRSHSVRLNKAIG